LNFFFFHSFFDLLVVGRWLRFCRRFLFESRSCLTVYYPKSQKNTFSIQSHLCQAKTDFLNSMPFKLCQNWLLRFHAISVKSKLISSINVLFTKREDI
jgi:hypothetical protein